MGRRLAVAAALVALAGGLAQGPAAAGPSPAGWASSGVEHLRHVPFEVGTATGARTFTAKGRPHLVVTSWKSFSIYDLSDPENPTLVGPPTPFGFKFENEDVATNGRIMLFSEELPQNVLHVWDVQDLAAPREIATLPGGGGHTSSCILDCTYSLSSTGRVVDLRRPDQPRVVGRWDQAADVRFTHDVTEVAPGVVLAASTPVTLLDLRDSVTRPRVLARDDRPEGAHSTAWPRGGRDRFALAGSETIGHPRCTEDSATWRVLDTRGWQRTGRLRTVAELRFRNGTYADGAPPLNGLGCSPHWFEPHPTFRDGGLVALGAYEHGTRFLTVAPRTGAVREVGWFVPWAGSTSAAYWVTPELVYSVDYTRGIDVLRYTGPRG